MSVKKACRKAFRTRPDSILSVLSVIPLFVSTLKFICTGGVDVLLGIRDEIESLRMDVSMERGALCPSHRPGCRLSPTRSEGYGQVSVTQQWLLQSFDLKLQSIEANPQDPRDLLVALSAQGS